MNLAALLANPALMSILQAAAGLIYPRVLTEASSLLTTWDASHPLAQEAVAFVADMLGSNISGAEAQVSKLVGGLVGALSAKDPAVSGTQVAPAAAH